MSLLLSNPILYLAKQFHKHSLEDGHWTLNGQIKIVRAVLLRSWSVWRERQVTSKVSKGWPCWWTMSMKEEVCLILCSYIKWIMAEFFSLSLSLFCFECHLRGEPEKQTKRQVRGWNGCGVVHWKGFAGFEQQCVVDQLAPSLWQSWLCHDTKGNREAVPCAVQLFQGYSSPAVQQHFSLGLLSMGAMAAARL